MIDTAEMEAVIEAALFATAEPIQKSKLVELFGPGEQLAVDAAIERVLARYRGEQQQGIKAEEVAGGIRLVTRPEMYDYLRRLFELTGRNRLSMAALETLAIVAYRQPITGPEIQELRGVNSSGVLKTLLERRLVRIKGRKMVVGKPFLYATTREFLMHFGLPSLEDLPPLEDFEEMIESSLEGPLALSNGSNDGDDNDDEIFGPEAVAALEEVGADSRREGEEEE
ncbi:MAG: SMC-Scp complex subunit ScpB [Acidobacteriota bacterium]|nr:SMC-Scp complex subunit ScpB [Acidobacteriota bacterium]